MEMLIGGSWRAAASGRTEEVTSPFDGAVIGTFRSPTILTQTRGADDDLRT